MIGAVADKTAVLVDDIIDEGAFSVMYGASGSGKSFVMMDIDFHIAMGRPWNGHDVRQGPVAYVAAEGGKVSHWLRGLAIAALQAKAPGAGQQDHQRS